MFLALIPSNTNKKRIFLLSALLLILSINSIFAQTESDDSLMTFNFDKERIILPCAKGCSPVSASNYTSADYSKEIDFKLTPVESSFDMKDVWFEYLPETGEVTVSGTNGKWTVAEERPGQYWLQVKINRGFETIDVVSKAIEIRSATCSCIVRCSRLAVEASESETAENQIVVFRAVEQTIFSSSDTIVWKVENGQMISGAGSNILKVRTTGTGGQQLKVLVRVNNDKPECPVTAELSIPITSKNENDQ